MSVPPDIDPGDFPPDHFPPPDPPASLPGLASLIVPRYSCNVVFSEEVPVLDALDVIFTSSRMYLSQGANGKVRMHNRKPADYAFGTLVYNVGDMALALDDVSAWVGNLRGYALIDPHTVNAEVRGVTSANYPLAQNSTNLTTSSTGTAFTLSAFAGADGASSPAVATITVATFTASTNYTVTLDGVPIMFTPSSSDTTASIAAFLAGTFRSHPSTNRRFAISLSGSVVTITARFGTLTVAALTKAHVAPVANPAAGGALTAIAGGSLLAGEYRVSYTEKNAHGETLLSPYKAVTVTAGQKITVPSVTPSVGGNTICWYVSPKHDSLSLRFALENNGASWTMDEPLPLLTATLPPDLNRTGTEVMRVMAVFSDRADVRSNATRSNVLSGSVEWQLGTRKKTVNEIRLKYRDSGDDWRLTTLRLRDDASIAKTRKTSKLEINGQAIDNTYQAYRIASGELAGYRDADFYYKWTATREALLLEEGDVVCITDGGTGVYNLPVYIEDIDYAMPNASMPRATFTASKYGSTLFDDSIVEIRIPIATG